MENKNLEQSETQNNKENSLMNNDDEIRDCEDEQKQQCHKSFENNEDELKQQYQSQQNNLDNQNQNKFAHSLVEATNFKDIGNQYFKEQDFNQALDQYEQAEEACPPNENKLLSIIQSNMAICFMKLKDNENAIQYCTKSIENNQEYIKPLQNRAQIHYDENKFEESFEDFQKAQQLDPNNPYFRQKIIELKPKVEQINEKRKEEVMSGLKNLGNTILGKFGMSLDNFKMQQNANGTYNINFQQ